MALTDVHQFFDILCSKVEILGNSLEVEWLGLSAFTVEGMGSIPGQESKILQAVQCSQNIK